MLTAQSRRSGAGGERSEGKRRDSILARKKEGKKERENTWAMEIELEDGSL